MDLRAECFVTFGRQLAQIAHRECAISTFGGFQDPAGLNPEQPVLSSEPPLP